MKQDEFDVYVCGRAVMHAPLGDWQMTTCFLYTRTDPLAVTIDIDPKDGGRENICWTFSRQLLDDAFSHPGQESGQGDVRFTYQIEQNRLRMDLVAGDHHGFVPITIDAEPVITFMEHSLRLMPMAEENQSVDEAIGHLLDGTWER